MKGEERRGEERRGEERRGEGNLMVIMSGSIIMIVIIVIIVILNAIMYFILIITASMIAITSKVISLLCKKVFIDAFQADTPADDGNRIVSKINKILLISTLTSFFSFSVALDSCPLLIGSAKYFR